MSIVVDQNLRTPSPPSFNTLTRAAANDDHLPRGLQPSSTTESTGGWNAYDVWRKLIKEARDRRESLNGQNGS